MSLPEGKESLEMLKIIKTSDPLGFVGATACEASNASTQIQTVFEILSIAASSKEMAS